MEHKIEISEEELAKDLPVHNSELFGKQFQHLAIVGMTNSGKTYSLLSICPKLMDPDIIFIVSPNYGQPIYKKLADYYKERGTTVINIPDIGELPNKVSADKMKDTKNNFIIFDDLSSKEMCNEHVIGCFTKGRHLRLNSLLIAQDYFSIPTIIRKNLTGLLLFPITSSTDCLFKDVRGYFANKHEFDRVYKATVLDGKKGSFLYISFEPVIHKCLRLRKNFTMVDMNSIKD
jgi:hypothetical protein